MRWGTVCRVGIAIAGSVLAALVVLGSSLYVWDFLWRRAPVSAEELVRADEQEQARRAVAGFERILERYRSDDYMPRGSHAKAHACVKAWFEVDADVSPELSHGVFSVPGRRYQAWVRLSNGHFNLRVSQDGNPDARGLAIKLLDPPGKPMRQAAGQPPSQDFLMATSPVFFARDIMAYNALIAAPEEFFGYFFPHWWNPFGWRLRELKAALRIFGRTPVGLLKMDYFSITPYRLGPHNVKYSARPCDRRGVNEPAPEGVADDYLRRRLAEELGAGEACLWFTVQKQDIGKYMPLEDPTVEWLERDSPFLAVAKIVIPKQDFNVPGREAFCEALSFAPWHALPEHRPLGQFNRMRRMIYPGSVDYRHRQNRTVAPADLRW